VIVVLGRVAHDAVLTTLGASFAHVRRADWVFGHAAVHRIAGAPVMIDSYHPSRYNTQTGRLTPGMLADVFRLARDHAV
jgi:uracil-DNA glycosylase